jgi:hypothetical protein
MHPGEPVVLVLDNAPTRGDLAALQFLAEKHILVVTLPPHLTHVMQPIDVCWARSFKTAYRRFLKAYIKEDALVRVYDMNAIHPGRSRRAGVMVCDGSCESGGRCAIIWMSLEKEFRKGDGLCKERVVYIGLPAVAC